MKKIKYYENTVTKAIVKTFASCNRWPWEEINEQQFYKKLSILKNENKTLYCFYKEKIMQV